MATTRHRRAIAAPRSLPLKIGLASYSMRTRTVDELVALCKEIDVHYVTLKEMHLPRTGTPQQLGEILAKMQAAAITVTGGGVINWTKGDEPSIRKDFEYARTGRLPMIVGSPAPEAIDIVEKLAKEFKMPVAIHNHGPEDKHYQSPREVLAAIKSRDKLLGACMDIGHTQRAGVNPVDMVAFLGDRLMDLHIKDLIKEADGKWKQVEVGRGEIDIVGLLRALGKRKFKGHVALEYEINGAAPEPGIKESIAYLRGVAGGLS